MERSTNSAQKEKQKLSWKWASETIEYKELTKHRKKNVLLYKVMQNTNLLRFNVGNKNLTALVFFKTN